MGIWITTKLLILQAVLFRETTPAPKSRLVHGGSNSIYNFPFVCSYHSTPRSGNNEIMYHELVFVGINECMESICVHHEEACLQYPIAGQHVCFKSRNYGDVCVYDHGSPVYCHRFGRGIFAILTRSFDCGLENMPAVYTLMSYITSFTKIVNRPDQCIEARPDYNDPKYIISGLPPSTRPTPIKTTTRRRTTRRSTTRRKKS